MHKNCLVIDVEDLKHLSEGACILLGYLWSESTKMQNWLSWSVEDGEDRSNPESIKLLNEMKKGRFLFGLEKIKNDLHMPPARQSRLFKELVSNNRVKVIKKGIPPRRWVVLPT